MKCVLLNLTTAALILTLVGSVTASNPSTSVVVQEGTSLITVQFTGGGSGTEQDPYVITNVNELQEIQGGLNAWYELGNDIDASETVNWNEGAGFAPIGDSDHGFAGHLDGNDFSITALYMNRPSTDMVGLFGKIDGGAVENIRLADPNVTGNNKTGSLTGYNYQGQLTNCDCTNGMVNGTGEVGGIVGNDNTGTITDCDFTGQLTGNDKVGGFLGYTNGGTIIGCTSESVVQASGNYCGGFAGQTTGSSNLTDCRYTGDASGNSFVGGLVGQNTVSIISACNAQGNVTASGDNCGGLVGYHGGGTFEDSHFSGYVTGVGKVGGLIGLAESENYSINNCSSQGSVTGSGDCCGGLIGRAMPTGGYADSFEVVNSFANAIVTGNNQVGGLIGEGGEGYGASYPSIVVLDNCHATGGIEGYQSVGGLVGQVGYINITYSYSTGNITGTDRVGGLVGEHIGGAINRCFSTGHPNASGDDCGGFVGLSAAPITDCFATGDVNGFEFIGGFVGETTDSAATTNCYSTGFVGGTYNMGGFAGYNSGTSNDCFWDIETSGIGISACGTGKTTAEMMQQATFDPPWNFATIWGIDEGQTYPYLMELSPTCGDPWHPYPIGDLNFDCHVDFRDFAVFSAHWLECTDPNCQ